MVLVLAAVASASVLSAQRKFKPGFNLFSKEQDVQLGKEAAAEIEKTAPVLNHAELARYFESIGKRLSSHPEAGGYPYTFKVVHDNAINAFALPGGPTYMNTGLIAAADNEAQLAGVVAHEISHVALRHGTNNVSKASFAQLAMGALGAFTGGSMLGQLAQLGVGLGANSLLLKFSRDAETQADLLGAQLMAKSGYNPVEMARFFEKLEAQEKQRGGSGPQFFSSHPNPGNRVKAVEKEITTFPWRDFSYDSGSFGNAKKAVAALPPPKPKAQPAAGGQAGGQTGGQQPAGGSAPASAAAQARPSGRLRALQGRTFALSVPENWEAFEDKQGGGVTIASRAGVSQTQGGAVEIGYGMMLNYAKTQRTPADLAAETEALLRQFQQGGTQPSNQRATSLQLDGTPALMNVMYSQSMFGGQREIDLVVTAVRPEGLFYLVLIAPESEYRQAQPVFNQIIQSVRWPR